MNDEPKIAGAPPEPEKPKVSGEDKPSFSFRELEMIDVIDIDGYRTISFMVRGEFIVVLRQFEYFNYLDYVFGQIEFLMDTDEGCTCDLCQPEDFEVIEENFKITSKLVDIEDNSIVKEEDKYIKMYSVYNLVTYTTVGGICKQ